MDTIKGKILVVSKKEDYYKIKDRVILVAKNTTPDVVININNIEAIVTEIDNKLCHAAIIAREFNKPLLMGIEKATKIFKTGDEAIIDFDKRIIKKI